MGKYIDEAFERLRVEMEKPTPTNELFVRYAIAAHTLYNFAKEHGLEQPKTAPWDDRSSCVTLIKQIRNVFAHSIVEPKWRITQQYRVLYQFDDVSISLTERHGQDFDFKHLGGTETLFDLRVSLESRI